MATVWHWILALLASLNIISPIAALPRTDAPAVVEQQYGDTPEVAGVAMGFPKTDTRKEAIRVEGWQPPETENLTAQSIMIMDKDSGKILWSRNPEQVWPLASMTKLVAAMVFVEATSENTAVWNSEHTITPDDSVDGTVYLYQGETVTVNDLFNLSLVGSINSATRAMFHAIGMSDTAAVEAMNTLSRSHGFWNTHFSDVTGLTAENVTTAKEAAWIIKEALSYEKIRETLIKDSYTVVTDRNRTVSILNTNKLLSSDFTIEGGKTGYIPESHYNFGVSIQNERGDAIIVVVLGSAEPDYRFSEASALAKWAFDNYEWQ